jgi:hypothetical protein
MQMGQCGSQEAHAEVLGRRRRAARAIAARANLPNFRLSRLYLLCADAYLPSRAAAGLRLGLCAHLIMITLLRFVSSRIGKGLTFFDHFRAKHAVLYEKRATLSRSI